MRSAILLTLALFLVAPGGATNKEIHFPKKWIQLGDTKLKVEIASTTKRRQRGLMHRTSLKDHEGMLFIFERPEILDFWMKNTHIPLDIGFFNAKRVLLEVHTMKPHDLTLTSSTQKAKYALEVNRGWFRKHKVRLGMRFHFTPKDN